jgi:hypothetical protein
MPASGALQEKNYLNALDQLMGDPAWQAKSQALRHFRITTGMEAPAAPVQVSVDQRTAVVTNPDAPTTFEAMLSRVQLAVNSPVPAQKAVNSEP